MRIDNGKVIALVFIVVGMTGTVQAGGMDSSGMVVKSRATMEVSASAPYGTVDLLPFVSGSQPISVVNGPYTIMTLDNSQFVIPGISNSMLDFGFLQVSGLSDNNLRVCGPSNNLKCQTAVIRAYTTGAAGPGLYNSADGYGAPLFAGHAGDTLHNVGLNVEGAVILQTISISSSRNTVKLTDFPDPKYQFKADFSDAGTGSFATTIVLEYALAP